VSIDVSAEIVIARPRGEVAAFVIEPTNEPKWIGGIVASERITPGPVAAGSRVRRVAKFFFRRIQYAPEVTEFVAGERLSMRTDKPFAMIIDYEFSDEGMQTRVRTRLRGGPSRLGFANALLARSVRRSIEGDLRRLRALLETPVPTPR
jgi:hypothetical protein